MSLRRVRESGEVESSEAEGGEAEGGWVPSPAPPPHRPPEPLRAPSSTLCMCWFSPHLGALHGLSSGGFVGQ